MQTCRGKKSEKTKVHPNLLQPCCSSHIKTLIKLSTNHSNQSLSIMEHRTQTWNEKTPGVTGFGKQRARAACSCQHATLATCYVSYYSNALSQNLSCPARNIFNMHLNESILSACTTHGRESVPPTDHLFTGHKGWMRQKKNNGPKLKEWQNWCTGRSKDQD